MTDEVVNVDKKADDVKPAAEPKKTVEEHMIPKSRFDEVNAKYKETTEKLEALERESQERLEKQLQEQGKYKELAEERAKALAEMQPKADQLDAAQATLKQVLAAQIEEIPEDKRSLVPDALPTEKQLEWIAKNRALLSKSKPFDIGAGKQGGTQTKSVDLTDEELAIAKKYGMTPEEYAKNK